MSLSSYFTGPDFLVSQHIMPYSPTMSRGIESAVLVILFGASACHAQLTFQTLKREVIQERLQSYKGNDRVRAATLKAMFQAAGCVGEHLFEQPVEGLKEPNLICILRGQSDSAILVGAHYDHVDAGDGVADNWSGSSLLPSFYQTLSSKPPQNTFIFVGFAGEEKGLVGSRFYVKKLPKEELRKIQAMICIDTLGLSTTEVWVARSDQRLVRALNGWAHTMNLPLTGVNVDQVGMSDEEPFVDRKIPVVMIHSVTQETLRVLHSPRDNYRVIKFEDYYDSYSLLSGYLKLLDQNPVFQPLK